MNDLNPVSSSVRRSLLALSTCVVPMGDAVLWPDRNALYRPDRNALYRPDRNALYWPCEENGTEPKPQKVKPKPRTELRAIQPRTRTRNLLL